MSEAVLFTKVQDVNNVTVSKMGGNDNIIIAVSLSVLAGDVQGCGLGLEAVSRPIKASASVLSQTDWQTPRSRNRVSRSWYL